MCSELHMFMPSRKLLFGKKQYTVSTILCLVVSICVANSYYIAMLVCIIIQPTVFQTVIIDY